MRPLYRRLRTDHSCPEGLRFVNPPQRDARRIASITGSNNNTNGGGEYSHCISVLADLRHCSPVSHPLTERFCHALRKLLCAAIEAPLRTEIASCQEWRQRIAAAAPEQRRQ